MMADGKQKKVIIINMVIIVIVLGVVGSRKFCSLARIIYWALIDYFDLAAVALSLATFNFSALLSSPLSRGT
jgi:hypothetical protein